MDDKYSLFNFEYTMNGFSKLKIAQISIICHCGIVRKYVRSDLTDTCFSFDDGGTVALTRALNLNLPPTITTYIIKFDYVQLF